jgi:Ca2+/Na+ antiporter
MRLLQYLYYRLYQIQLRGANNNLAAYKATIFFGIFILLNITTLFDIAYLFLGKKIALPILSKQELIAILIAFEVILYYLFARKSKLEDTINLFKSESEEEKKKGKRAAIIYLITSFACFGISMILMAAKNRGDL